MAVRPIDGNALHAEISKWKESVMYKDWVQSAIAHAPTLAPPNEWVSVEDRLPENGADVLMWRGKWKIAEAGTYRNTRFWVYDEIGDSYVADDITHWMPLPEPPDPRRRRERRIKYDFA